MKLHGKEWTRREIEARVGRLEQIGGIQKLQWTEGPEAQVEQILVRTGAGLAYYVSPMRGMDISHTSYGGEALSWQSANGDMHPSYYDATGGEWLRTAAGGLLMTCGLTHVGAPDVDGHEVLGLHGRAHHLAAKQVCAEGVWVGDEYEMRIRGHIDETTICGHHLRMTREICSRLGENRIFIKDVVENMGFSPAPHMMMYHFNFGFPLLMEETKVMIPTQGVGVRDQGMPIDGYDTWEAPDATAEERVYFHQLEQGKPAQVSIVNPVFPQAGGGTMPLQVRLQWQTDVLPHLVHWRMPGAGAHVLGIEPANCLTGGRVEARRNGTLIELAGGESISYEVSLEVVAGSKQEGE